MRISDWSSDVCSSDLIGVFGLALGLTYPLLSIMMVDDGFSDFFIGINGSATCVGVLLALFVLPGLLRAWGAFAVVVPGLAASAACLVALPYKIGRAPCKAREGQYVSISSVAVT